MEDKGKYEHSFFDVVPLLRNYGRDRQCIERVLDAMDDADRMLLEKLYIVPKEGNIGELCQDLGVEKTTVYRWGRKALRRFAAIYTAIRVLQ